MPKAEGSSSGDDERESFILRKVGGGGCWFGGTGLRGLAERLVM